MKYPVNIRLTKLKTLEDAEYPQEERFPSSTTIKEGLMWAFSKPKVGKRFPVLQSKMSALFVTSLVKKITKIDSNTSILKTLNSEYKLEILKNKE